MATTVFAGSGRLVKPTRDPYLVSPTLDAALLIFSPVLALAVAATLSLFSEQRVRLLGIDESLSQFVIGVVIAGHIFISFVRSHGNPAIFAVHRIRFAVVPVLLMAMLVASDAARAVAATVAVIWDVHHSSLQTFGLARMYGRKAGHDPQAGRTLELLLNYLLYAGPILAGAGLMVHIHGLYNMEPVGLALFTEAPAALRELRPAMATTMLGIGVPFISYYAFTQWQLHRAGHVVSWQKVALLGSTALCSVVSWGLNSFGLALFTMKLFHCVQYFTLVAWTERDNIGPRVGAAAPGRYFRAALVALVALAIPWGLWAELQGALPEPTELALSLILTATLLHFWYDGFIWSVRKKQL